MPREATAKSKKKRRFGLFKRRSSKTIFSTEAGGAAKIRTLEEANKWNRPAAIPKNSFPILPTEVKVSGGGSPGQISVISDATGLDAEPQLRTTKLSPLLPLLTTDGDTIDESLFGSSSENFRKLKENDKNKVRRSGHFINSHKSSFFSRSKYFRRLSNWAFDKIDTDGLGQIDRKELYAGLLLIHLNLAVYAGPAACKPAEREYVDLIFEKMDANGSGCLDKDEFVDVMTVLFSQVFTRVVLQWSMTIMIVPLISQYLILAIQTFGTILRDLWKEIDEFEPVTECIMHFVNKSLFFLIQSTPTWVKSIFKIFFGLWNKIPESILLTIPVTIVSCILGCIAVPWMMFHVDDFFRRIAESKKERRAVSKPKKPL